MSVFVLFCPWLYRVNLKLILKVIILFYVLCWCILSTIWPGILKKNRVAFSLVILLCFSIFPEAHQFVLCILVNGLVQHCTFARSIPTSKKQKTKQKNKKLCFIANDLRSSVMPLEQQGMKGPKIQMNISLIKPYCISTGSSQTHIITSSQLA